MACTTASSCIAVGLQTGTTTRALATKWNGTAFSTLTTASTTSELYGVGCSSATACFAVGTDYASGAVTHAESYNGTTWSASSTPNPSGSTFSELESVACPSSMACFASGWYQTSGATLPILERWNGSTWSLQSLTLPSGATSAWLPDIACTSSTACTAVGYYDATSSPRRTLVARWNGTSWATQTSVNPSGATSSELQGIACTSSTSCTAVGDYVDSSSVQHSLAESWNGTTWTQKTVPDPSGGATGPALYDVSCWTSPSTGCAAVGGDSTSTGNIGPLAASWNGTAWSLASVPTPAGVTDASLSGVSCPTTCMAVGVSVYDGSTGPTGLRPAIDVGP